MATRVPRLLTFGFALAFALAFAFAKPLIIAVTGLVGCVVARAIVGMFHVWRQHEAECRMVNGGGRKDIVVGDSAEKVRSGLSAPCGIEMHLSHGHKSRCVQTCFSPRLKHRVADDSRGTLMIKSHFLSSGNGSAFNDSVQMYSRGFPAIGNSNASRPRLPNSEFAFFFTDSNPRSLIQMELINIGIENSLVLLSAQLRFISGFVGRFSTNFGGIGGFTSSTVYVDSCDGISDQGDKSEASENKVRFLIPVVTSVSGFFVVLYALWKLEQRVHLWRYMYVFFAGLAVFGYGFALFLKVIVQ